MRFKKDVRFGPGGRWGTCETLKKHVLRCIDLVARTDMPERHVLRCTELISVFALTCLCGHGSQRSLLHAGVLARLTGALDVPASPRPSRRGGATVG